MNNTRNEEWRIILKKNISAKDRSNIARVKMPEIQPEIRNKSHIEVNSGLSREMAIIEARRCLDCANPACMKGCPVGINIPDFIKHIESEDFLGAAKSLKQTNALPAVCGRVCPQEAQCEAHCIYTKMGKEAVAIGYLERFAADFERKNGTSDVPKIKINNKSKVAIIGSGPAGLSAAGELVKKGYQVKVFEALHALGGVLRYGIPEFRLPNEIVDFEINNLKKLGVEFITNSIVGRTVSFSELKSEGYEAFFIGSGAGLPKFMNIPGENYNGILSSNEYLTRVNLMGAAKKEYDTPVLSGKNVAVIGGGNTAMDSVRTAKRLGATRAIIIYRRTIDEMPARKEEIRHAKEEGIEFLTLHNPVEYKADQKGRVKEVILQKMELGTPDASGRRRPVPIPDSEFSLEINMAIVSVGVSPNPLIPQSLPEINVSKWGTIEVDEESMHSNIAGYFAGGDIIRGGATVILAMGDGKKAANHIHEYIQSKYATNKVQTVIDSNAN
jgi:glutamate synthase (NADPH/NADH) small chain